MQYRISPHRGRLHTLQGYQLKYNVFHNILLTDWFLGVPDEIMKA